MQESVATAHDPRVPGPPKTSRRSSCASAVIRSTSTWTRQPMAPVARMAFDDVCDAATIRQFEAVLAWALKVELPRGALLERIEQAGGVSELLNEFSKAA